MRWDVPKAETPLPRLEGWWAHLPRQAHIQATQLHLAWMQSQQRVNLLVLNSGHAEWHSGMPCLPLGVQELARAFLCSQAPGKGWGSPWPLALPGPTPRSQGRTMWGGHAASWHGVTSFCRCAEHGWSYEGNFDGNESGQESSTGSLNTGVRVALGLWLPVSSPALERQRLGWVVQGQGAGTEAPP